MNDQARYVVSPNFETMLLAITEIMRRNNSGRTVPKNMIKVTAAMLNGHLGMAFSNSDLNAWLVPTNDANKFLVWFGTDYVDDTEYQAEGNMVPEITRCRSAYFLQIHNAMEAVEKYLLYRIFPDDAMPPGHLQSLTG